MKRRFLPFVGHVNFQTLFSAETAYCLDRVNLTIIVVLTNLDESIVKGCPAILISVINVYTLLNQKLLDFKSSVSSGAGEIYCVMK